MHKALDFTYHCAHGEEKQLSRKVQETEKTFLYFSRYIGCPFCQLDIMELCGEYHRFREKNAQFILVLQSTAETIRNQSQDFPFDVACDPEGKLYELYGVKSASSALKMINPLDKKLWKKAALLLKHKLKHGDYEGNEQQLPALFLLDKKMNLLHSHLANSISDMLSIDEMIQLL